MVAYYSNGNAVTIARLLRHKSWKSTQKYVHTIEFKEEDFEETTATTLDEIRALGKLAGLSMMKRSLTELFTISIESLNVSEASEI